MHDIRRAPCWASLPPELVGRIADCLVATNDVDCYMDFRAVCRDWRQATDDPTNTWDLRFRPCRWIVFCTDHRSTALHFLNTSTGLFLHKDMPLLRKYHHVAATHGGFLVLVERNGPGAVYVLNPFTGHLVRFIASSKSFQIMKDSATVFGSPPLLALSDVRGDLYRASPCGAFMSVHNTDYVGRRLIRQAMVGGVYELMGHPFLDDPLKKFSSNHAKMFSRGFLVQSGGEVLMVINRENGAMEVFKIDAARNAIEPVKSIGEDRAIFVGVYKCVSVNASKFPSINGNCIYYVKPDTYPHNHIYMYDMKKEK